MNLTPTQQRLFDFLQDGYPHSKTALRDHLGDKEMEDNALYAHIHALRRKINRSGLEIVGRSSCYQLVRLLHSAYDGKR